MNFVQHLRDRSARIADFAITVENLVAFIAAGDYFVNTKEEKKDKR
jgi:hypothetical protein